MATCQQPAFDGNGTCGGAIDATGYCENCGTRAESPASSPALEPSTAPPPPDTASPSMGSPSRRSSSSFGRRSTAPPPQPDGDPRDDLPAEEPVVPEYARNCRNPKCGQPVGRAGGGRPGPAQGFCTRCGWEFSFRAPLRPGTSVADRYEVLGVLGRGGLGWVYLATDTALSRPVALKGLQNPDNPEHRQVAVDELRALVDSDHPNIVTVYDIARHVHEQPGTRVYDRVSGEHQHRPGEPVGIDYLVMEYVRGRSLLHLLREERQKGRHLPVVDAGEYLLEALAALGHLHEERGLLYNDLSPDNLMLARNKRVKLIDLGGVSRLGDATSGGWGKKGYRDPFGNPPSPQTDIYTCGRTLAVLTMDVPDFRKERQPLPGPDERHESFHLLLHRATHPDPERRFAGVHEMADQLRAVLREERALRDGEPQPGLSEVFGPEVRIEGADADRFPEPPADRAAWALALPDTQVDRTDPHARRLAALSTASPLERLQALELLPDPSREVRLRAVRARLELMAEQQRVVDGARFGSDLPETVRADWARGRAALGDDRVAEAAAAFADVATAAPHEPAVADARAVCGTLAVLRSELDKLAADEPYDVRVPWLQGVAALVVGATAVARAHFTSVRSAVPGEAAPTLALGLCAELLGDAAAAARHYATVWRTDRGYLSAAFGLARAKAALGEPEAAVAVLVQVPPGSRFATEAALSTLVVSAPTDVAAGDPIPTFFATAARLDKTHADALSLDDLRRQRWVVAVLDATDDWLRQHPRPSSDAQRPQELLGVPLVERGIRKRLEQALLQLSKNPAVGTTERIALVDRANSVRNWSLW